MRKTVLLLLALALVLGRIGMDRVQAEEAVLLTADVQLKIADAFLDEAEYYRAVTEFKRFLILFPDSRRADYALFRTGMACYRGEEYESAARAFASVRELHPGSVHQEKSRYYEALSCWKLKQYAQAEAVLDVLVEVYPESEEAPRALAASTVLALERGRPAAARRSLHRILEHYPGHLLSRRAADALPLVDEYEGLPSKSPSLAGFMSAVLPGSGYIYARHYHDGVTAFLINALAISGTAAGVHQENYPVAGIVGAVGLPFYFANIYGSANAARKWNMGVRKVLVDRISLVLDFHFHP
jgi:TolA-binding protein